MVVEVAEVAVKEEDIRLIVIQISIIALRIEALFGFILWLNPLTAKRGGFVKYVSRSSCFLALFTRDIFDDNV